mmetsp:Transcript_84393/g.163903  ORF Transcript_84393/g.163903 Transcript_84393/m.163903 type:complete len:237 (-) Transcript_84393:61-771(-)
MVVVDALLIAIGCGFTSAFVLFIPLFSGSWVKSYRHRLLRRCGLRTQAELVSKYITQFNTGFDPSHSGPMANEYTMIYRMRPFPPGGNYFRGTLRRKWRDCGRVAWERAPDEEGELMEVAYWPHFDDHRMLMLTSVPTAVLDWEAEERAANPFGYLLQFQASGYFFFGCLGLGVGLPVGLHGAAVLPTALLGWLAFVLPVALMLLNGMRREHVFASRAKVARPLFGPPPASVTAIN